MSSTQPTSNSSMSAPQLTPNSTFDENRWVIQIRQNLEEEIEEEAVDNPVSIFSVPKILMAAHPICYVPQIVALGPYHHWRAELLEMERYKLSAAKRTQKQLHTRKFHNLVNELTKMESRIRDSYHRYLDFKGETLAWMMAVDASFLLEFLQVYAIREGKVLRRITSRMSHLVDHAGRKSAHNAVLRDTLMMENQIPIFILRKILESQLQSIELADDMLNSMLTGLNTELSPFEKEEEFPNSIQVKECSHLLDFMYHMIVPKSKDKPETTLSDHEEGIAEVKEGEANSDEKSSYVKQLFDQVWALLSKLNVGPVRILKSLLVSKPATLVMKLPWKIVSSLPGFKLFKEPIENFFSQQNKDEGSNSKSNSNNMTKPPLIEEITIPSVIELSKAGVNIFPIDGTIFDITFDVKKFTLYLPAIRLDVNTEVALRNLVAYEACLGSGPLVLTRYTEFMNGIIDTEEDAKFLRERGILFNHLKSDKEAANLWNGMSRSVRLTKVKFLDKVIEDVNKHYNGRWKVKAAKFMKVYVFNSWKLLTFFAAIFFLLLTTLQAFCSVYSCARFFHVPGYQ